MRERWRQLKKNLGAKAYPLVLAFAFSPAFIAIAFFQGRYDVAAAIALGLGLALLFRIKLIERVRIFAVLNDLVVYGFALFVVSRNFPALLALYDQYEWLWVPIGFFLFGFFVAADVWVFSHPDIELKRRDFRVIEN